VGVAEKRHGQRFKVGKSKIRNQKSASPSNDHNVQRPPNGLSKFTSTTDSATNEIETTYNLQHRRKKATLAKGVAQKIAHPA
jgi:YD repeat-containing protein